MKEGRLPPICSKGIRVLCQTGLIVVSLIPLAVKDVFADVTTNRWASGSQILFVKDMRGNEMIENTKLYETIFKRKSIREYDLTPLDEHTLAEIMAHTNALKPLYDDIKIEMKLLSQKDVKGLFLAKAPHYLAVFSETKDGYLTNVGFMLQQMDLFFSANGMGSCWQGMPKPTKEILNRSKLEFVILLAFGKPKEKLHRESVSEFKRKPLREITDIKGADELLEPARLAPSAMNRQQWFFTGGASAIHAYRAKSSFLTAFMFERMSKISVGIAICHVWIAAKHFGKEVEFISDKEAQKHPPSGHEYVITIKIK
ncbi:MAG: nitroreductase family protein [Thermodesulfobacteriota bacterium]